MAAEERLLVVRTLGLAVAHGSSLRFFLTGNPEVVM
jgi:hypothetical protein